VDSGLTALALWEGQAHCIDLLLTDLVLPGDISGPDLASRLRQTKPHLKVLFSSDGTEGQPLTVVTADQLVAKPYSSSKLLQAVQCCLAKDA
ncbi:MAG TPA: response regulator, partial [Candidatus Sulfotelmatobacter sp.]|nr:response regulator [Candidatus Sulfotelmatobacter sp.]